MIVLFTGDHLRHKYLVDSFSKVFDDLIWIIEKREKFMPNIDKNFNAEINKLQKTHFEKRLDAENKFFKSSKLVVPLTPYKIDDPNKKRLDEKAPSIKYFKPASTEKAESFLAAANI